jgi:RecA-family ATPase
MVAAPPDRGGGRAMTEILRARLRRVGDAKDPNDMDRAGILGEALQAAVDEAEAAKGATGAEPAPDAAEPPPADDAAPTGDAAETLPGIGGYVTSAWPEGMPAPIEYQVAGRFARGFPHLIAAAGGVGKSHSLFDLACKLSMQPGADRPMYWMGAPIESGGRVVVFTAEDDQASIQRRMWSLYPSGEWRNDNLIILPLLDMKLAHRPMFARIDGRPAQTLVWTWVQDQIARMGDVAAIMFDPAQKIAALDLDKDNTDAQFLGTSMMELATETGAGVYLTHHMNKTGLQAKTIEEVRQAIRGATALVDGVRLVYAMWALPHKDAEDMLEQLSLNGYPKDIVKGAVVKENIPGVSQSIQTFHRQFPSGRFRDITERADKGTQTRKGTLPELDVLRNVREFLEREDRAGRYYSRNQIEAEAGRVGCGKTRLRDYLRDWLDDGRITAGPHPRKKGVVVVRVPAGAESDAAAQQWSDG